MRALLLAALAVAASGADVDDDSRQYMTTCYYGSWAVYRPGQGKFDVENIDPYLCTHLIYGFAGLDESRSKIKALDPWNDLPDNYGKGAYLRFTNLKKKNPALKTILAIGGWNEGSEKYSQMASNPSDRKIFAKSCVDFLKKYNFDGLDMDWEYPAERGGKPVDKDDYVALLKDVKEAFEPEGLILTAAVGPGKTTIDDSYNLPEMAKYLDIFNVMAYDYHGSWDPFTGHNSPLYLSPLDIEHDEGYEYFSVNYTVNYYIAGGVPRSKMVMGIPLYGHGFTLNNADVHGLYAPANQPQPACPYTRQAGVCGYNEICVDLKKGGWTSVHDPDQKALYVIKGKLWVGFDDIDAIKLKTDYIKSMGLGGSMVWSIETDDFHNLCGHGVNPLMTEIWRNLNGDIPHPTLPPTTPGPTPSTTDVPPSTTPAGPTAAPSHFCKRPGLNPDPDQKCSPIFYECVQDGDHWDVTKNHCADGTVFDATASTCIWKNESEECNDSAPGLVA